MERTTVYLTEGQKRALARAAKATGRSEAELIREGVEVATARIRAAEPDCQAFEAEVRASGRPLVSVDVRSRRELAGKYGVAVVPTAFAVAPDGAVTRLVG